MATSDTTPGTPRLLRSINDRSALELLIEHGPLTRTRIGALTGLSKPTASQLVDRLLTAALVVPAAPRRRPGPSAQLYAVNPAAGYAGGLDVTHTRVTAAVADLAGQVVGEFEVPVVGRGAPAAPSGCATPCTAPPTPPAAPGAVRHVVIGVPGAPHPETGQLGFARDLPGWHGGNLGRLRELLGVRVDLENDVNLAAIAEQHHGQARGADDFVVLWLGNGIGLAIIQDGRFVRGATGGAGEIGYMPVALDPDDPALRAGAKPVKNTFQNLAPAGGVAAGPRARHPGGRPRRGGKARGRDRQHRDAHHPGPPHRPRPGPGPGDPGPLARRPVRRHPARRRRPPQRPDHAGTARRGGPRPALAVSTVEGNPVLAGAIHAALRAVRADIFSRGG
ncbi:ROK family transcriptional regulator [Catenulispora yoronensis]